MALFGVGMSTCLTVSDQTSSDTESSSKILAVEATHFTTANPNIELTTVSCTLSDGTKTKCYQIVTDSAPTDHQMGPWCPETISDEASHGGIWIEGGKVHDVDGEFIKNLANFYEDDTWQMYDDNGNVFVTATKEDCVNAANPGVGEEYQNFCVECLSSYMTNVSQTWLIPIKPVPQAKSTSFLRGHGGPPRGERPERPRTLPDRPKPPRGAARPGNGIPATRGIALNGVEFSAPAPVNAILGAYTLAPFDDAGGHINVHQGYHYHAATGLSFSIEQSDGHAALIGYAMDGYGIYANLDADRVEPEGLDECRGHYDDVRGYHYHVDKPGNNNFINCLYGAFAIQ